MTTSSEPVYPLPDSDECYKFHLSMPAQERMLTYMGLLARFMKPSKDNPGAWVSQPWKDFSVIFNNETEEFTGLGRWADLLIDDVEYSFRSQRQFYCWLDKYLPDLVNIHHGVLLDDGHFIAFNGDRRLMLLNRTDFAEHKISGTMEFFATFTSYDSAGCIARDVDINIARQLIKTYKAADKAWSAMLSGRVVPAG